METVSFSEWTRSIGDMLTTSRALLPGILKHELREYDIVSFIIARNWNVCQHEVNIAHQQAR